MRSKKLKICLVFISIFIIIFSALYGFNYLKICTMLEQGVHVQNIDYSTGKNIFSLYNLTWFDYININEVYYVSNKAYYSVMKYTIPKEKEKEYYNAILKNGWYVEKSNENTIFIDTWDYGEEKYIEQYQNENFKKEDNGMRYHLLHKFEKANTKETIFYIYSEIYSTELRENIIKLIR